MFVESEKCQGHLMRELGQLLFKGAFYFNKT